MRTWVCFILAMLGCTVPQAASARDYGQQGAVFAVLETDLLKVIELRLKDLEASGGIERMNREFAGRAERKVQRPDPVPGMALAVRDRSWTYDPAIVIDHDVTDPRGRLIARRGQRINPLELLPVKIALVFIDGDEEAQVRWAVAHYRETDARLIMVRGAPLEAMTRYQRRFYFDQGGALVDRFGIRAVPAVVETAGLVMQVREIPVSLQRGS